MTPELVLDKYRDLVAVNSSRIAHELSDLLKKEGTEDQRRCFGGDMRVGFIWLYRNDKNPGNVLECIVSEVGDAITSVYKEHRSLQSINTLAQAREELIGALVEKIGLSRERTGIEDPGRGRSLGLEELSTAQMIDLLAEQMGSSIVVTNSIGMDASNVTEV